MIKKRLLGAGLSMMLCAGAVGAAETEDLIKYRQATMKAVGGHMGAIAAIVMGKVEYSDHLKYHASGMSMLSKTVGDVFPSNSADGETDAKPEIWSNPGDFKMVVEKLETAASELMAAVDSGNQEEIGIKFKALGGSCKACHDDFRVKRN